VSWWPGDGTAVDIWGSNNGAESGTVSYLAGKVESAFTLDSEGDYIRIPYSESLQPARFTVDFWFRSTNGLNAETAYAPLIVNLDNEDVATEVAKGYDFYYNSGSGIHFDLPRSNGTRVSARHNIEIAADEWHHVAGTFDGRYQRLYFDGVLVDTIDWQESEYGRLTYRSAPVLIGFFRSPFPSYFSGQIDEVELFGRALTADEIQSIVDADSLGKCKPGPTGYVFTGTVTSVDDEPCDGCLSSTFTPGMTLSGSFLIDVSKPGSLCATCTEANGFSDYFHGLTSFVLTINDGEETVYTASPPFVTGGDQAVFDGFQVANDWTNSITGSDRFVLAGRLSGDFLNDFGPIGFLSLDDPTRKAFVDTLLRHVGDLTGWTERPGHTGEWYLAFSSGGQAPKIRGVITSITREQPIP
jgi:hypothetical protein